MLVYHSIEKRKKYDCVSWIIGRGHITRTVCQKTPFAGVAFYIRSTRSARNSVYSVLAKMVSEGIGTTQLHDSGLWLQPRIVLLSALWALQPLPRSNLSLLAMRASTGVKTFTNEAQCIFSPNSSPRPIGRRQE